MLTETALQKLRANDGRVNQKGIEGKIKNVLGGKGRWIKSQPAPKTAVSRADRPYQWGARRETGNKRRKKGDDRKRTPNQAYRKTKKKSQRCKRARACHGFLGYPILLSGQWGENVREGPTGRVRAEKGDR